MNEPLPILLERTGLSRTALSGQTAVVTGAGRGIGRQVALALACLGANVVVAELDEASGRSAAVEIGDHGGQARFIPTDVSQEASVQALAQQALAAFGQVDLLINNAILCPAVPLLEMSLELWERVMAVNLRAAFLTCRAFLPGMLARGSGTVINMVSTDAMPGLSAYIASKQGLSGFSQSLAAEVGAAGIRVIAFAPGMVDTPGIRAAAPGLVPLLGMTQEQFLSLSLHPAYAGLMPPEHAGVATVYLAAVLAGEFHGETVDGYSVLERTGLIHATPLPAIEMPAPPTPRPHSSGDLEQIAALTHQMEEILRQTALEFEQLPVFVRPMARGGFKNKAGQSLSDWQRLCAGFSQRIQAARSGDPREQTSLAPDAQQLCGRLEKLIVYYQGVPAETARFTKDTQLLSQIQALTAQRIAVIRSLEDALYSLAGDPAGA
ncbi:MAG: SDR family oxidoreductase [Chloroflexi bacterium]|nr:SDR family oxidoreductase [Chloroflexota bacterium]